MCNGLYRHAFFAVLGLTIVAQAATVETGPLSATFDTNRGSFEVNLASGEALLKGAVSRAVTTTVSRATSDSQYERVEEAKPVSDALGNGKQIIAHCTDAKGALDIAVRLTTYDQPACLTVETICTNTSHERSILLPSIEPIRAAVGHWAGASKLLTNGKMYYDAGAVRNLKAGETIEGWWSVCFYAGERQPALVIGYLENKASLGRVLVEPSAQPGEFSLTVESGYQPGFTLEPGQSISSDRVIFVVAKTPYHALEAYAQAIADVHQPRLNPPINGWCSWFSVFGNVTEQEVLRNAEFAAKHLKPCGFEYIQIDDGFYRAFGDWEGNAKFPHGMKWLASKIRELGLKPGIWFAPYVIGSDSAICKEHPDWLVHRPDGKLKQIGPGLVEDSEQARAANPKLYALDISHPQAAEWFGKLFDTAANDWGYEMFKIDFVDWSLLTADRFYRPTATRAGLYRQGFEIMRQAVGPRRHLLDCGPGPVTVGLLDSMRIELDQPPVTWNQYFLQPASSGPAMAKRYYYHGKTWISDADMLVMHQLTVTQAQAAATLLALSGGNSISGDRLTDLDAPRLEILKKTLPSYGHAARPVDMFEQARPEVFALPVKRAFDEWMVVALFNTDEHAASTKSVAVDRLGLDPAKTYIAFDFWQQRFYGEIRGTVEARLAPSSVLLLCIHEQRGVPQVISTDRHITQGAMDLESVQWEAGTATLRGVSAGPRGTSHYVYIHLPDKHPWVQADPFFFYDYPGYTLKITEPQILRVQVRFDAEDRVRWAVDMRKLFGG